MVKIRDSRIELLRIVPMWTVLAHHFVVHNADSVSGSCHNENVWSGVLP